MSNPSATETAGLASMERPAARVASAFGLGTAERALEPVPHDDHRNKLWRLQTSTGTFAVKGRRTRRASR